MIVKYNKELKFPTMNTLIMANNEQKIKIYEFKF